jgi:hypothetical protein
MKETKFDCSACLIYANPDFLTIMQGSYYSPIELHLFHSFNLPSISYLFVSFFL